MHNEKTIYLLEDDIDIRTLVSDALSNDRYRVFQFSTIHTFQRKVLEQLPDLFILDVHLPDGNGTTVTSQLADHRTGPVPPVIVMTADIGDGKKAISNGARFLCQNPFTWMFCWRQLKGY